MQPLSQFQDFNLCQTITWHFDLLKRVPTLASCGDVSTGRLAHLDLTFHCDGEEDEEVDDEDGPEDGDVEALKECTHRRYEDGLRCTIPVHQKQHNHDTRDTA